MGEAVRGGAARAWRRRRRSCEGSAYLATPIYAGRARPRLAPDLAAALRAARVGSGLSRLQPAERTGLSVWTLQRLEISRRSPSRQAVNRLIDALQLPQELRERPPEAAKGSRVRPLDGGERPRRPGLLERLRLRHKRRQAAAARRRGERTKVGGRPNRKRVTWKQLRWRRQRRVGAWT